MPGKIINPTSETWNTFNNKWCCKSNLTWNSTQLPPHNLWLWKLRCLCPFHDLPGGASPVGSELDRQFWKRPHISHTYPHNWRIHIALQWPQNKYVIENTLHDESTFVLSSECSLVIMAGGLLLLTTFPSILSHSLSTSKLEKEQIIFGYLIICKNAENIINT